MYLPKLFEEKDRESLFELVDAHPFATLIASHAGGALEIAHAPVLFERRESGDRALAHVARGNPLAKLASQGARVTIVVNGPHGYVSPRWYTTPREQVPTWNYAVVHLEGATAVLGDAELQALLGRLSQRFEADADEPWQMSQLAPEFLADLARGIVGFEVAIESVRGKFKLSQNRSPEDHARVTEALEARGSADDLAMARLMRKPRATR